MKYVFIVIAVLLLLYGGFMLITYSSTEELYAGIIYLLAGITAYQLRDPGRPA